MVWGCFIDDKLGPLIFIDRTVDKFTYVQVLKQNLLPFIDLLKENGVANINFQQDNASPHRAKITMDWLQTAATQHGFTILEFPPNSPDLNPIEHLWSIVKTELYRQYPDTMFIQGSEKAIREKLRYRINKIWWGIQDDILKSLIDDMPKRIQAVIKAKGWYTEY